MTTAMATRPLSAVTPSIPPRTEHRRPASRWTCEDIAAQPARYLAWLKKISTEYWLALNHPHTAQDYETAISVCRAYKAQYAEYTRRGNPVTLRPQLDRQAQVMKATLARMGFCNPVDLWEQYQSWQARDQHGRHPDHTREIEALEYTLWQREISRTPAMDVHDNVIYNNIDAALERTRARRTTYAPADDAESPAAQLTRLQTRIANLQAHRQSLPARIRQAAPLTARSLKRLYNRITTDLEIAQAEYQELDQILHPQKYGIEMDPADQRELIALAAADYGLTRTAPIPADGRWQIIDLDERLADTLDSIRSLLSWHVKNQDVIFEMETCPQDKRSLGHIAHLAARYDLQGDIIRSLGIHHSRQIIRHAPAPPLPAVATTDEL